MDSTSPGRERQASLRGVDGESGDQEQLGLNNVYRQVSGKCGGPKVQLTRDG